MNLIYHTLGAACFWLIVAILLFRCWKISTYWIHYHANVFISQVVTLLKMEKTRAFTGYYIPRATPEVLVKFRDDASRARGNKIIRKWFLKMIDHDLNKRAYERT